MKSVPFTLLQNLQSHNESTKDVHNSYSETYKNLQRPVEEEAV